MLSSDAHLLETLIVTQKPFSLLTSECPTFHRETGPRVARGPLELRHMEVQIGKKSKSRSGDDSVVFSGS